MLRTDTLVGPFHEHALSFTVAICLRAVELTSGLTYAPLSASRTEEALTRLHGKNRIKGI